MPPIPPPPDGPPSTSSGGYSGPSHLGRYAVRRRIGSGGFATVWLGYDEQLDAPVAIKVLADNWSEQHEVRNRFVEEGRYLRRVESPHVVPVYDAGALDDGRPYLVMAYADQGSLSERLAQGGVTVPQALEVITQVGRGLQALHDRGILHRDVKPANVLFRTVDPAAGADGVRAMVGDLGLGKALDVSSRLTMIAGTPAYVAPEQAQGETPDARADQFSLGVLSFLLLAGRLPWHHTSLSAAAGPTEPEPLSGPDRVLPDEVEQVVRRALAHDRQYRYDSVAAYVDALGASLGQWDEALAGPGTRLLPVDTQLTQPGVRPSTPADDGTLAPPVAPGPAATPRRPGSRGGRVAVLVAAAVVGLGGGAAAGYGAHEAFADGPTAQSQVTVTDTLDLVSVTVPTDWAEAEGRGGWLPPNGTPGDAVSAVSVGTSPDWVTDAEAEGVFAGLLPGDELPEKLPRHPECSGGGDDDQGGDAVTAVFTGCPDGVVVERVLQVSGTQLLWVQIRSRDQATAKRVLEGVTYDGF